MSNKFLSIRYDSQTKDFVVDKLENVMTHARKEFGLSVTTTGALFSLESTKPILSDDDFSHHLQDKKTFTMLKPKNTTVEFVFQNQTYVMNARSTDFLKAVLIRFCGFMGRPLLFEPAIADPDYQRVGQHTHVFSVETTKKDLVAISPVQLFVKGLSGKTTIIEIPDVYCTGSFVKNCIEIKHKIPARYQQILCNTKVLVDGLSLIEQDITAESTLHLSTKMIL